MSDHGHALLPDQLDTVGSDLNARIDALGSGLNTRIEKVCQLLLPKDKQQ